MKETGLLSRFHLHFYSSLHDFALKEAPDVSPEPEEEVAVFGGWVKHWLKR
jgi:hypothetical protein